MNYILPVIILIIGTLFCAYQIKQADFKPVVSYKYAEYTLLSKEKERHLFLNQHTKHTDTLVLNCVGNYNIGDKVKITYKYVDKMFSKVIC